MENTNNGILSGKEVSLLESVTGVEKSDLEALSAQITDKDIKNIIKLMTTMVDYKDLIMRYTCALKEIQTKFEVLNTEFNTQYKRNPIAHIKTRIKSNTSIINKLLTRGLPFSVKSIERNINDIAGIRIICSYLDDIYSLAEALIRQDDITLIEQKDYIKTPKPNGYRSLHLIVDVPVFFADGTRKMRVEVQIRTIAMDFWASLEHQIKYKKEINSQAEIVARLKDCAETIAKTDEEMMEIRKQLEFTEEEPDLEDELLEKLKRLDKPII